MRFYFQRDGVAVISPRFVCGAMSRATLSRALATSSSYSKSESGQESQHKESSSSSNAVPPGLVRRKRLTCLYSNVNGLQRS